MSINFNEPVNDEAVELVRKEFSKMVTHDRKTFLFDGMTEIKQSTIKKIANAAKQPVTIEINGDGDIKTLSDGTRYQVTPQGWRKLGSDSEEGEST